MVFTTQPAFTVQDAGGNTVTTDASSVTLSITPGTPTAGGPGTLSGCTQSETLGVITFASCKINTSGTGYTLTATDGALTTATTSAFNVTVGPAASMVFTTVPGTSLSATTFTAQPVVTMKDAGGNVATGSAAVVTLAINSGTGTLACTTNPVTAVSGVASFAGCKITLGTDGTFTLKASATGLTTVTSAGFAMTGVATKVVITTQPTSSTGGQLLTVQPVITIQDASSKAVTIATNPVTLAIATGTGTLNCTTNPVTPVNGVATFAGCSITLGTAGNFTLSVTSTGLTSATSSAFSVAGTATKVAFTTQPAIGGSGIALVTQPVVKIQDATGNVVTIATNPVTLAIATGTGTLNCTTNPVTPVNGVATFAGCSITLGTAGNFTLSATATGLTSATSSTVTVAGPATKLVVTTQPPASTGGVTMATQPVVKVEDVLGDVVPNASAFPVTLSINSGSGTLSCTTNPVTPVNGTATFAGCKVTLGTQGTFSLIATTTGLTSAISSNFTVAGAPTQLVVTTSPGTSNTGVAFTTQPIVKVEDSSGDVVTNVTTAVTLTVASGTGTLSCTTNPANTASGSVTFAGCKITLGTPGTFTLSASASGLTGGTSASFLVNGAPSQVVFTTMPSNAVGAVNFPTQPVVKVEDNVGNVVTNATSVVTLAINTGTGTLTCTTNPVTAVAGVATFAGCKVTLGTAGSFTLTASTTGLNSGSSASFTVAGPATKLVVTTSPSNSTGSAAFTTQPIVKVQDAVGDVVTNAVSSVTLSISSGSGTLTCTTNPVTAVAGVATFAGCKITLGTAGSFTLSAAAGGLTSGASSSFTVAGPATKLVLITQPSGAVQATPFGTQPQVAIEDAAGNIVTTAVNPVTLTITSGTGTAGATLSCTSNPVSSVGGIATFSGCAISTSGTGYTLTATASGLTSTTSASFDVA